METHHELAALVARLGPAVLDDPADFRAAFDDHAPDHRASDGQVNLLTDAIRLGTFARVLAQLAEGARPGHTLDAQAFRLARLRGGADVMSARWALAALLFALGKVDEDEVVGSLPRTVLPDERTVLAGPLLPLALAPPSPEAVPTGARTGVKVAIFMVVAVLVVAALTVVAVLVSRGGGTDRSDPAGRAGPADVRFVPAGMVVGTGSPTADGVTAATLAGRTAGVEVGDLGAPEQVDDGSRILLAAPGSRLRTFTLADGPCQERPCAPWSAAGLEVVVAGTSVPVPAGGPTYVVAVPDGATVELRMDADGYDQRVSLVDGTATGRNIAVLVRSQLKVAIDADLVLRPTADAPLGPEAVRAVHVADARLFFFNGPTGLANPRRAYLTVGLSYTTPDDPSPRGFELADLHLEAADGTAYPRRDLSPDTPTPDPAFVVPASFRSGTLVIAGTRRVTTRTSDGGTGSVLLTLPRTTIPVRFD
ncbi:hypothetical protein ACFFOS_00785 [Nocardioides kongjuensis]|uniref:Uncharacterized protein n=1 Tax=Nocardioides kongjuensis TaxID=349522 RepID=A0A852RPC5_9ACTN|nr:hypothetical protein [Nocardioides kongjuensis]NYD29854.1 hypothetical protein [Nocardioides kongjuensis]